MHKIFFCSILLPLILMVSVWGNDLSDPKANKPDPQSTFQENPPLEQSVWLFAYFTNKNNNRNGLHFAWSADGYRWTAIGPEHSFLKSDYGSWSTEKKMRDPFIMQGPDGIFHCLWTINWDANVIGHASSRDLIHWSRQSYPKVMEGYEVRNIWAPEMIWDEENRQYIIFWASTIKVNGEWKTEPGKKYDHRMYFTTTKDFKSYTPAKLFFDPGHNVIDVTIRKVGEQYIMIYKDERELPVPQKNLLVAVSDQAEGPYQRISETPFTKNWVEGPAICRLPDGANRRDKSKVYLGEYASWGNTLYNALAEAAYMTSLERNGDVVELASYAPLLAKEAHTQWGTDLIFFNNTEIKPTVNYFVQKLFSLNSGNSYLESKIEIDSPLESVKKRITFSVVEDPENGDVIIKLVNLLPSPVLSQVILNGISPSQPKAVKTVLSGMPEDRNLMPVTSECQVGKEFPVDLPAWSLTVIRVKAQEPVFPPKPPGMDNRQMDGYRGIWFELNQKYPYGDKYSGGLGTYTADHIPMAVYSAEADKTFFVYGGTTGEKERHLLCMAGCFDHRTGKVTRPTVVCDKGGVNDPHDNPVIQIDKAGYLWVFVSGRGRTRPGFKYRSAKPHDISKFELVTTEEMTYPQPWISRDRGFIHLFTKYTGVRLLYYETSLDGYTWSEDQPLAAIREPGDQNGGHYQISHFNGEILGTFFNRHPNGNVDQRTDLYYLQTTDMGKTWTTADGRSVELPLTDVANPARVINYKEQELNVYLCDMQFDYEGYPACIYVTSRGHEPGPGNSPYQWKFTRWNGSDWETYPIMDSDHNYDMGSLYLTESGWRVIAPLVNGPRIWGAGGEVAFYESADNGKTWQMTRQITCNSPRNHGYVRRPLNARDPFYAFWADGDPGKFSISKLYFGDSRGNVWQLPYEMKGENASPIKTKRIWHWRPVMY